MSNLSVETPNLHKTYYAEQYLSHVLFIDLGDSRWSSRTKKQVKKRGQCVLRQKGKLTASTWKESKFVRFWTTLAPTSESSTEVTETKMGSERTSDSSYLWNYTEN